MNITASLSRIWHRISTILENPRFRRLFFIVVLIISFGFIALTLVINWKELRSQITQIKYGYILLAVALYPVGMLPTIAGWHFLLRSFDDRCSFITNLRFYCLSTLSRHIPGFVMFVASRSVVYQQVGASPALIAFITGLETLLLAGTGFVCSILLIFFGAGQFFIEHSLVLLLSLAGIALFIVIAGVPMFNRLLERLKRKYDISNLGSLNRRRLVLSLIWMLLAWVGGGIILYVLTQAIFPIGIARLPMLIGIWGLAGAVSLTIGIGIQGMGIREITIGALLSIIIPTVFAVTVAVVFRFVLLVGEVLWVFIFVLITPSREKESQPSN